MAHRVESAMFLVSMRAMLLTTCLLAGCTGFHPLSRSADQSAAADPALVTDASSPRDQAMVLWTPKWQQIGESVQGRPLRMAQLGRGPRRVLWVGGIHGNEREGRISTMELPRALMLTPGALEQITLTIFEDANPDGAAQNTRGNAHGVDLNRNYPATNFKPSRLFGLRPLDQPEARALHDLIQNERPHLVIVAHSWHDDHFINFDGPAEHLAERFSRLSGYRVKESDDIAPTPGSLGSWVGKTMHIPILTLEYHRGREPWAAWNDTKAAILSVVLSG